MQRCGCLWIDPVCAKQITEGRRSELSSAIDRWKKRILGGCLLLTLTFSHSLNMPLTASLFSLGTLMLVLLVIDVLKRFLRLLALKIKLKG